MIATKQEGKRDNLFSPSLSVMELVSITILNKRLSDNLKITPYCYNVLLVVYAEYIKTGFGLSCQELCNIVCTASVNYVSMNDKLLLLCSKGLIEIVGTTKGHAKLFAPTPYLVDYIGSNYRLVECEESAI